MDRLQLKLREDLLKLLKNERKKFLGIAFKLASDIHDAEDLLQETTLKALKNIDRFKGDSTLDTWLTRIMQNTWKDMLRAKARRGKHVAYSLDEPAPADPYWGEGNGTYGDREIAPENPFEDLDLAAAIDTVNSVRKDTAHIPFQVSYLRIIHGHSNQEVAGLLNITAKEATVAYSRGRKGFISIAGPAFGIGN